MRNILDRGAFASTYPCLPRISKAFVFRVTTRPAYDPTACKQVAIGILLGMYPVLPQTPTKCFPLLTEPGKFSIHSFARTYQVSLVGWTPSGGDEDNVIDLGSWPAVVVRSVVARGVFDSDLLHHRVYFTARDLQSPTLASLAIPSPTNKSPRISTGLHSPTSKKVIRRNSPVSTHTSPGRTLAFRSSPP